MQFRHELMKKKYPDKPSGKGIPLTGIANARPETKGIKEETYKALLPIDVDEYINYDDPTLKEWVIGVTRTSSQVTGSHVGQRIN